MITEGVVGEFGDQPVVLMRVALPVGQDQRRIEIGFDGLEEVLYFGTLEGHIPVAEPQHLDLLFGNVFEEGGGAVLRLGAAWPAPLKTTHRTTRSGNSATRRRMVPPQPISMSSACAPKQSSLSRPRLLRWNNKAEQAAASPR